MRLFHLAWSLPTSSGEKEKREGEKTPLKMAPWHCAQNRETGTRLAHRTPTSLRDLGGRRDYYLGVRRGRSQNSGGLCFVMPSTVDLSIHSVVARGIH